MFLSDLQATPDDFWKFWCIFSSLTAVLASLSQIVSLFLNRKESREVSFAFDPAGKDDFEKHIAQNEQAHRDLFAKIGGVERGAITRMDAMKQDIEARIDRRFDELAHSNNDSRGKIHERINLILQGLARLEGRLNSDTVRDN